MKSDFKKWIKSMKTIEKLEKTHIKFSKTKILDESIKLENSIIKEKKMNLENEIKRTAYEFLNNVKTSELTDLYLSINSKYVAMVRNIKKEEEITNKIELKFPFCILRIAYGRNNLPVGRELGSDDKIEGYYWWYINLFDSFIIRRKVKKYLKDTLIIKNHNKVSKYLDEINAIQGTKHV
ncbi:MAG: hypothetical protein WC755_08950 [Candidatus Woesearchaeota archaeon]|jgi:hypothetical protein